MSHAEERRYSAEEIIAKLREAEVLLGQGKPVAEVAKALGIDETTDYRWRAGYGGMKVSQAKRLKEPERENARLRKAVADLTPDEMISQEATTAIVPLVDLGAWFFPRLQPRHDP